MSETSTADPRIGLDAYLDWVGREGLPVATGLAIDAFELETADWPRYGIKGAVAHLDGRGDYCNMFKYEIPKGGSSTPQQHMYEEIVYVLEGHGSTQIESPGGVKRSFEWGVGSMFAVPLNVKHRHFNGSGSSRALLISTTNMPIVLKMFHNERFVFDNGFDFDDRIGKDEYYAGKGDLYLIRQGNNTWETNFVPDLNTIPLTDWSDRGAGGSNVMFVLADGSLHAHLSEMQAGTYKKAHRHLAGTHVTCVAGTGYSLLWYEGDVEYVRVDWQHGTVFPPAGNQFHQHFVTSKEPVRYLGTALGSIRYPITEQMRLSTLGEGGKKQAASSSVKDGGNQIEYEDQDPEIHEIWLAEMKKHGITPAMDKWIKAREI